MYLRQEILDAIQAISLILIFTTVFFNIKYPYIIENLNQRIPEGKMAKEKLRNKMLKDLLINNLTILIFNSLSFYLFLPLSIKIISSSNINIFQFDILKTGFIFIVLWIGVFLIWSIILFVKTTRFIFSIKIRDSDLVN